MIVVIPICFMALVWCLAADMACECSLDSTTATYFTSEIVETPSGNFLVMAHTLKSVEGVVPGPMVIYPASQKDRVSVLWADGNFHIVFDRDRATARLLPNGRVVLVDGQTRTVTVLADKWPTHLMEGGSLSGDFVRSLLRRRGHL